MTESQEIKLNRIVKKLEDAKKELKGLATDQTFPLNAAERGSVLQAKMLIDEAIYHL